MRIIHVVTLASSVGAFGGPMTVAVNQLESLANLGHEVELIAGSLDAEASATLPPALPASLFPVRRLIPSSKFSALHAPGMARYLKKRILWADLIHIHLGRDLITMPAARIASQSGARVFLQPHGMLAPSKHWAADAFDRSLTRPIMRRATEVLALTAVEMEQLKQLEPGSNVSLIDNGVPLPPLTMNANGESLIRRPRVLYLARLAPRKRPELFVEAAEILLQEGIDAEFELVGPDEGCGSAVEHMIHSRSLQGRVKWIGPADPREAKEAYKRADVYVLPSVGEVVPMSVLEAMSMGVPVVVTTDNGLANRIARAKAGVVVDTTLRSLVEGMRSLLVDATGRREAGSRARLLVEQEFSIQEIIRQLLRVYSSHR